MALLLSLAACTDDPAGSELSEAITATGAGDTSGPLTIISVAPARPVVTTDERQHLLYELLLQNTSTSSVELVRIDAVDPDCHRALATFRDEALDSILTLVPEGAPPRTLAPGGIAIAYFDLTFPRGRDLPDAIAHRIAVRHDRARSLSGPTVAVLDDRSRSLGPPLHGDRLFDLNGCCDGPHRRALLGLDTGLFLAQRFAIDFVRIDDQSTFAGDPTRNDSYFLFGAEVVATASGRVVAVSDGMPENVPTEPLPPFDVETAAGNHVVQALDDGRFVLYAHLQNGSVRVRPGDRVRRGHVLGRVGNTGNSTEPHLHFHVMDNPSPLASNGLPFTFDHFKLKATVDITGETPIIVPVPPPQARHARLPMNLDIVAFP